MVSKKINNEQIEQRIREINGTMTMEDMPLTEELKNELRAIIRGEISTEESIKKTIDKYSEDGE